MNIQRFRDVWMPRLEETMGMEIWGLPVLIGAIAVVALLFAEAKGHEQLRVGSKLLASAAFVWGGWSVHHGPLEFERWLLGALVLCALGDAFLLSRRNWAFLAGLGTFLLAHVAFCMAFWVVGIDADTAGWTGIGASLLCSAVGGVLVPRVSRGLRIPVALYIVVTCCMVAFSVGAGVANDNWWLPVAGIAFLFSDLAVGLDRFVQPGFIHRAWGLPLYFAAQWAFVGGMAAG